VIQLSCTPRLSRALSHGTPLSRCLKRQKSALLKSSIVILLFALLRPLRNLSSTVLWSLLPRLPLTFTSLTVPSLLVSMRPSRSPPSLLYHLFQEVVIDALQGPPGFLMPFSVAPPAGIRCVNRRLLLAVHRRPHPLFFLVRGPIADAHYLVTHIDLLFNPHPYALGWQAANFSRQQANIHPLQQ